MSCCVFSLSQPSQEAGHCPKLKVLFSVLPCGASLWFGCQCKGNGGQEFPHIINLCKCNAVISGRQANSLMTHNTLYAKHREKCKNCTSFMRLDQSRAKMSRLQLARMQLRALPGVSCRMSDTQTQHITHSYQAAHYVFDRGIWWVVGVIEVGAVGKPYVW